MGRIATKMPNFCLNRIRPLVRVRSPPSNANSTTINDRDHDQKKDGFSDVVKEDSGGGVKKPGAVSGRKIMIVVDSSAEAKNAVQWALSHTVQNQDMIVLLYVTKPSKQAEQSNKNDVNPRIPPFLTCMKSMCQLKMPEVHVEVAFVEGKEKGPIIVEEAKRQEVGLLVLGQKKRSVTWRLMLMWAGNRVVAGGGVAEYCVQNATCMAIAVRRKSKKLGGYLITTKRQKDFWLLA
ncbi:hypothetical protein BUALT_Bualt17G0084400 [Buddleja alternifolia]|uniref:UspA domain-containing protein n=1 Tax=Buddleja alternifolia TaxID=168488 RepID=A0AAV6WHL1_9LAMI|nr:hypothetical protein BUALT_Bualt17G0084400 [Buddleja alternifolia]